MRQSVLFSLLILSCFTVSCLCKTDNTLLASQHGLDNERKIAKSEEPETTGKPKSTTVRPDDNDDDNDDDDDKDNDDKNKSNTTETACGKWSGKRQLLPFFVAVYGERYKKHQPCSGVILNKDTVMIAKSCAEPEEEYFDVVISEDYSFNNKKKDKSVRGQICNNKDYTFSYNLLKLGQTHHNDFELIKLDGTIEFNERVQPACLIETDEPNQDCHSLVLDKKYKNLKVDWNRNSCPNSFNIAKLVCDFERTPHVCLATGRMDKLAGKLKEQKPIVVCSSNQGAYSNRTYSVQGIYSYDCYGSHVLTDIPKLTKYIKRLMDTCELRR